MEGFILAAGLGTRLRPLTDDRPKALVEIGERRTENGERRAENGERRTENGERRTENGERRTLLEEAILRLEGAGIRHIVVNVHHFADKVVDFIAAHRWQAAIDISDERDLLLDTGGGLKHAAPLFSGHENILVHNVDILSDIDLRDVERQHTAQGNLVTLCVSKRQTKRMLMIDEKGLLKGRYNGITELRDNETLVAFSGISVVSPGLFGLLPEADHPYPVIDEYIRLSHEGHRIGTYLHPADHWLDVGKPETLEMARQWKLS